MSALFCFVQLYNKKISIVVKYASTIFGAIIVTVTYYPYVIEHVFTGYRGKAAFDKFSDLAFFKNFYNYIKVLNKHTGFFIVLFIVCLFSIVIFRKKTVLKDVVKSADLQMCFIMSVASVLYIIIISKVAPYIKGRYIFCIYPVIIISLIFVMNIASAVLQKKFLDGVALTAVLFAVIFYFMEGEPEYLYKGFNEKIKTISEYDTSAVYITDEKWKVSSVPLLLASTEKFHIIDTNMTDNLINEILEDDYEDIVLFVSNDYSDQDGNANIMCENMGFSDCDYLMEDNYCKIYYCFNS